jgi:hypothetical protein
MPPRVFALAIGLIAGGRILLRRFQRIQRHFGFGSALGGVIRAVKERMPFFRR